MNCSEIVDNDVLFEKVVHRPQPAKLLAEDINRHTGDEDGRCTSDILVGTCNRAKVLSQKLQTALRCERRAAKLMARPDDLPSLQVHQRRRANRRPENQVHRLAPHAMLFF